ncbi:MAG: ABC transporter substrate-binding protein [Phascolarctobacterium sp.]|jgi:arginine ABC transporter, periplasmic arginine-binding protein ArtP
MKFTKTKTLLTILLTLVMMLGLVGCGSDKGSEQAAKGDKWVIAINSTFPPFETVKEGTSDYQGIDIDLAKALAKKMHKDVQFVDMKFASLVPTLQSGRADLIISAISPTDERLQVLDFSKPYYFPMKAIICKKGANFDALDKLKGHKAGASMGTTFAKDLKAVGGIDVVELDTTPLVVQDIKNGRLAGGLFDSSQAAVFIKQHQDLEMHIIQAPVLYADTFAIAMPKGSQDKAKIDQLLQEMRANGELQKILEEHLGADAAKQYAAAIADLDIAKM